MIITGKIQWEGDQIHMVKLLILCVAAIVAYVICLAKSKEQTDAAYKYKTASTVLLIVTIVLFVILVLRIVFRLAKINYFLGTAS